MSGFQSAPSWSFGRADQHPMASATDSPPKGANSSPAVSVASGTRPPSSSSEVSRRYAQPAPPDALRKRRRDIQADSEAGLRTKRPTPDPGPSAAPSLSRESSNELPDEWKDILGGSDFRAIKREQELAEEQVRQDKERKAQQEIDAVVGSDRLPNYGDENKIPYVNACVMEVRLYLIPTE